MLHGKCKLGRCFMSTQCHQSTSNAVARQVEMKPTFFWPNSTAWRALCSSFDRYRKALTSNFIVAHRMVCFALLARSRSENHHGAPWWCAEGQPPGYQKPPFSGRFIMHCWREPKSASPLTWSATSVCRAVFLVCDAFCRRLCLPFREGSNQ